MRTLTITLLALLPLAQAAEKHPWAKFKPGSYAKMKTTTSAGPSKTVSEMTQTLISIDANNAVVEIEMKVMGQSTKNRTTMPLKSTGAATPTAAGAKAPTPTNETLSIAGKSVAAKCYDTQSDANGMKTASHACMSETVPGGMVKVVSKTSGAVKMETVTEVVEFAAK